MDRRDWAPLQAMIDRHEGRRRDLYFDTKGIPTIGAGRNLRAKGLSNMEIEYLRDNDIQDAIEELSKYSWYSTLNQPRQAALIDAMFTLGPTRFAGFQGLIAALSGANYARACAEMIDSKWHFEAPKRVEYDAALLLAGAWPE